ncbi:MAG: hypothetical protein KIT44_16165, partial [Opitutaceae bacterium]|nr:hypothetical protein [Opitutaceae bacterium]
NVTQHAQAKCVTIRLRIVTSRRVLAVRDDGRGFDPSALQNSPNRAAGDDTCRPTAGGNGLRNFHTRSESLGGRCEITSKPGRGTEVEIVVPLVHGN